MLVVNHAPGRSPSDVICRQLPSSWNPGSFWNDFLPTNHQTWAFQRVRGPCPGWCGARWHSDNLTRVGKKSGHGPWKCIPKLANHAFNGFNQIKPETNNLTKKNFFRFVPASILFRLSSQPYPKTSISCVQMLQLHLKASNDLGSTNKQKRRSFHSPMFTWSGRNIWNCAQFNPARFHITIIKDE